MTSGEGTPQGFNSQVQRLQFPGCTERKLAPPKRLYLLQETNISKNNKFQCYDAELHLDFKVTDRIDALGRMEGWGK